MKKLLIATNLLTLTALLLFSFTKKSDNANSNLKDDVCFNYSADVMPKIPLDSVISWKENFKKNDIKYGNESRSVWYSLRTLKRFIWFLENEVKEKRKTCKINLSDSLLGVRIYFARYSKFNMNPDGNVSNNNLGTNELNTQTNEEKLKTFFRTNQNQRTVFLIPTYFAGSKNIDFDPRYFSSTCNPLSMKDVKNMLTITENGKTYYKPIFGLGASVNDGLYGQNEGTLAPPPPVSNNSGATLLDLY